MNSKVMNRTFALCIKTATGLKKKSTENPPFRMVGSRTNETTPLTKKLIGKETS